MGPLAFGPRHTRFLNDEEQRRYAALPLAAPAIPEQRPPQAVDVVDCWYEQAIDAEWLCAYRLALTDGDTRLVVSEIRIFPGAAPREPLSGRWAAEALGSRAPVPAGGIKARAVLRKIRLRAFEKDLTTILKENRLPQSFRAPDWPPGGARRGRKRNDRRYARVAVLYAQRYERGSTHPTRDVATRLRLSPAAARSAVATARKLGFLTVTERGERSGRATPQAFAIVNATRHGKGTR